MQKKLIFEIGKHQTAIGQGVKNAPEGYVLVRVFSFGGKVLAYYKPDLSHVNRGSFKL